jgi:transcription antitermination factor NusG
LEIKMPEQVNSAMLCAQEADPRWYAVCTTPRHEKRVTELMSERAIETFLPLYRTTRQWKKRLPVSLELPLFPTYLFVRILQGSKGRVLSTPGVLSFVGNGRHAISVPDGEIDALRLGIQEYPAEPHPYFAVGEKVCVKSGPLAGFTGTLIRQKTGSRVVLTIDAIMQGVAVEIDSANLEPAAPARAQNHPAPSLLVN